MNKKTLLTTIVFFSLLLTISTVSAGIFDTYYDKDSNYKRTTSYTDKETSTNYFPWGKEKTTYSVSEKTTIERDYYPPRYSYSYSYPRTTYYKTYESSPTYKYTYPSYSNYRYKEPYNSRYYIEETYEPYYYQPRYDYNQGHYSWRY